MKRSLMIAAILFFCSIAYGDDDVIGRITGVDPDASVIDMSGVKIEARMAKIKDPLGKPLAVPDLLEGDPVHVDGYFVGDGRMVATKIERMSPEYDAIEGRIDEVNAQGRIFYMGGIKVIVDNDAVLKDNKGEDCDVSSFQFLYTIKCMGSWTGPKVFTAEKVEMD